MHGLSDLFAQRGRLRINCTVNPMWMKVVTWNLFHGRALPPAGRELQAEFAACLAGWAWDVALLQEVPPWWPPALAVAAGAQQRTALTSRNALLGLRRFAARRWPDAIKSNGGGANAVLVRGTIVSHRAQLLRRWPERRVAQLLQTGDGVWVANYHGTTRVPAAQDELDRLAAEAVAAAGDGDGDGDGPVVVGGDLNLRAPETSAQGLAHVGGHSVDHIFARGLEPVAPAELLDRGSAGLDLSDHVPLRVTLRPVLP